MDMRLLFVMQAFLVMMIVADDCVYEECDCFGVAISCSSKGLTVIPLLVPTVETHFESLDFDFNMITWIPAGTLPPNLRQISLEGNPIEGVNNLAFNESATTLESLSFSGVRFTRIPDAILHLTKLTSFSIYDSIITDWNVDAMIGLGNTLQMLIIQNCSLTVWPSWIQNSTHLTQLSLSSNSIASLPEDALDSLVNSLATFSIDSNDLTAVPKALSKLRGLNSLFMQQNKITDVTFLPKTSKLASLSIHTNYIFDTNQLNRALIPYADSLYELDIENNRLESIPDLTNFTRIGTVDLSHNRISDTNSGSLPHFLYRLNLEVNAFPLIPKVLSTLRYVTDLVMSSNSVKEIRALDFPSWIVGAELDDNLIVELTDTSFPENSVLQFLHLSNNPISAISKNAFKNVPKLYELRMQYTRLTRLPLAFSSTVSLHAIDFTGSALLVCTCQEKSLQAWITSLNPNNVIGDCGITSIYDFYVMLSPYCSV